MNLPARASAAASIALRCSGIRSPTGPGMEIMRAADAPSKAARMLFLSAKSACTAVKPSAVRSAIFAGSRVASLTSRAAPRLAIIRATLRPSRPLAPVITIMLNLFRECAMSGCACLHDDQARLYSPWHLSVGSEKAARRTVVRQCRVFHDGYGALLRAVEPRLVLQVGPAHTAEIGGNDPGRYGVDLDPRAAQLARENDSRHVQSGLRTAIAQEIIRLGLALLRRLVVKGSHARRHIHDARRTRTAQQR